MGSTQRPAGSPLAHPLFRALWLASVGSHIASYMTDVGQGWLMTTLAPSPVFVSLLFTAESLPFFALGLPAGALADIVDRRRLLIATQIAMTVVVGTLAAAALAGAVTPWLLLALAMALGTATALNDPAWLSITPELLPKDEVPAGVTLSSVGVNVARTLGPALGGVVVAAAGPGVVFVLDALSFLAVAAVLATWRRPRAPGRLPAEHLLGAMRAGLRFARHSDPLRHVLAHTFAFMVCGTGVMALMPLLARETGNGPVGYGLLLGSFGGGAVAGATVLPRVRARAGADGMLAGASLVFAAAAGGAALLRHLGALCPVLAIGGVAWIHVVATLNVAAQDASPPWVRARALAVYLLVFQGAVAGGSALWGAIAASVGLPAAYLGIGIGLVLGVAITARLRLPVHGAIDYTPAHHWPEPVVTGDPSPEAGPIMVQVEYSVDASNAAAFRAAITAVGRSRRRDGAMQWWLFQDTADPQRFVETWIEATWAEHLRNHERVSVAHRDLEDRARALLRSGTSEQIRHFIAPATEPAPAALLLTATARP
jgi:predicted MFS family arabinose efflux permease/quinol monooxygenase YgiN